MKKFFLLFLLSGLIFSCNQTNTKEDNTKKITAAAVKTIDIKVEGMTCTGCENTIQEAVGSLPGVTAVKADHVAGKATVTYDTTKTSLSGIADAIKNTGYTVLQ